MAASDYRWALVALVLSACALAPLPARAQVAAAIANGDARLATTDEIENALLAELGANTGACAAVMDEIYADGFTATPFPRESVHSTSANPANLPLQSTLGGRVYSWVGEDAGGSRYAVYGNRIFSHANLQVPLVESTLGTMRWLLGESAATDVTQLTIDILFSSNWTRDRFQSWITANSLVTNWNLLVDSARLTAGTYDLWIQESTQDANGVATSLGHGLPFIAWANWYAQDADVLSQVGLTHSFWNSSGDSLPAWASVNAFCSTVAAAESRARLADNLINGVPDFAYDGTNCTSRIGTISCNGSLVLDPDGDTLSFELLSAMNGLRSTLRALDAAGTDLFSQGADLRVEQLLVLLADKYRDAVVYPMDKDATSDTEFYRAQFADYAVHYARANNLRPANLGRFAQDPGALDALVGALRSRTYTPTEFNEWTATGLYAAPGRTLTVRRKDNSTNVVHVRFNMLRNTTRWWNDNRYFSPKFITSASFRIEPGRDYTLSTPYGGPLYVSWRGVASDAVPFEIEVDNSLEHPFLDGDSAAEIAAFNAELATTPFEWIDIRTPFAEIHTPTRYASNIINGAYAGDGARYLDELNRYLILNNYAYAGFFDPALPSLMADVQGFCTVNSLDCTDPIIHKKPKVQHINGDLQALCGALCSGNPFDSGGAISPLGFGESHEMGHNLQRNRLKIYGGRSGETSNNIFPIYTRATYAADQGEVYSFSRGGNKATYDLIQDAIAIGATADANHPLWVNSGTYDQAGERLGFYLQLAYSNGTWNIYTQLYLVDRLFGDATGNDTKWAANKDKLFFSTYSRSEARAVNGNDFMYVVTSCMTGRDQLDYFTTWGIEVSAKAVAQVQTCGPVDSLPIQFYHTDNGPVYADFPGVPSNVIPLDGIASYRDPDIDNDRARNENDDLPFEPTEQVDTDSDGIGNNADTDDDNDGASDAFELTYAFDPLDPSDGPLDTDNDGFTNAEEDAAGGTNPRDPAARPTTSADRFVDSVPLGTARTGHTATLLASGAVLVTGGAAANGAPLAASEVFDPTTSTWGVAAPLASARVGHRATRLGGGRVLLTGGFGAQFARLATSDVYDPVADSWSVGAILSSARDKHTATVLADGRVLVAGGADDNGAIAGAEIIDAGGLTATPAPAMRVARSGHSATLLADGRVLVAGGRDNNTILTSAEIYDPVSNGWIAAATLAAPHHEHSASLLADGSVLLAGSFADGQASNVVERYNAGSNSWLPAGSLLTARGSHIAVVLPDGSVLMAGGASGANTMAASERATAPGFAWQATGQDLSPPRIEHTATQLDDGRVLIVGGVGPLDGRIQVLSSVVLYAY